MASVALVTGVAVSAAGSSPAKTAPRQPVTTVKSLKIDAPYANSVAVDSRRGLAYIADQQGPGVTVFNENTGVAHLVKVANYANSIGVDQATGYAYIPNIYGGDVEVLAGTRVVADVDVQTNPGDVTIDQATGLVYVDNNASDTVSVLKGTKQIAVVPVGREPIGGAANPANGLVYIPNAEDGTLTVIRGTSVVRTITVGADPQDVAVDPGTGLAYALSGNAVYVLHDAARKPVAVIPFKDEFAVTVNPHTHLAYVSSPTLGTVSVLRRARLVATVSIGESPNVPVVDPDNGVVAVPTTGAPAFLRGTRVLQRVSLDEPTVAGFDTRTGRAVLVQYNSVLDEVQTPASARITVVRRHHRVVRRGERLRVKYRCTAGVNNAITACRGTRRSGSLLPDFHLGRHVFRIHAHSKYGPELTRTMHYRVTRR